MNIKAVSAEIEQYAIAAREQLHKRPCVAGDESETVEFITKELTEMGVSFTVDSTNNVIAKIDGFKSGKRLLLRADFDALPVTEETHLKYQSEKPGIMHACGHDFHTAALLSVCKILSAHKDEFIGTVYPCFQTGEERSYGAKEIISHINSIGGVNSVFAVHVVPFAATGEIVIGDDAVMAGSSLFEVCFNGHGGHGSMPWLSNDPIKPACETLQRLNSLASAEFSAFDNIVVNICSIQAGQAGNIIPDTAIIKGNVRYFYPYPEILVNLKNRISKISKSVAESWNCTAKTSFAAVPNAPCVNSPQCVSQAIEVCKRENLPFSKMKTPLIISDNFSDFLEEYGGIYAFCGISATDSEQLSLHSGNFSPDEGALKNLIHFELGYVAAYLDMQSF